MNEYKQQYFKGSVYLLFHYKANFYSLKLDLCDKNNLQIN